MGFYTTLINSSVEELQEIQEIIKDRKKQYIKDEIKNMDYKQIQDIEDILNNISYTDEEYKEILIEQQMEAIKEKQIQKKLRKMENEEVAEQIRNFNNNLFRPKK